MKRILQSLALLVAASVLVPVAHAADATNVHAILIMASNAKAPADPQLGAYEAELQRNFPESSFRLAGQGSAGAPATINLGQGYSLELSVEKRDGEGIHAKVRWMHGNKPGINGGFVLQPGIPLVLGRRPAGDGEVPIVLVICK